MATRGPEERAAATLWVAFGVAGALGCDCGCWTGCCLPPSILVLGGLAVGKYLFVAQPQPISTSTLRTTARMMFLLSFNVRSSREQGRIPVRPTGDSAG